MIPLANLLMTTLWAWAAADSLSWIVRGWFVGDGWLQAVLALAMGVLLLRDLDLRSASKRLAAAPDFTPTAAALAVGSPIVTALVYAGTPLDLVRAVGALGTGFGIVGLFVDAATFRRMRAPFALALLLLPLTDHLDVIVGWPLRKGIAEIVAALLGAFGSAVPTETVIRIDGGIAHVDLPCAGVRGLWSGAATLLLGAVASRRTVDPALIATALLGAAALVVANVTRVLVVVGLSHVLATPMLAEIVHQPLGLLGYAFAAATVGVLFARARPSTAAPTPPPGLVRPAAPRSAPPRPARWLAAAVAVSLMLAGRPTAQAGHAAPLPVSVPPGWTEITAETTEQTFAGAHDATVRKIRTADGTAVLVASRSWIAHHVPQQCLTAAGWSLSDDRPAWVDDAPFRVAAAARDGRHATAVWWLQSAHRTTDDHVVRIRQGVWSDEPWVLVSVLLEGKQDPSTPEVGDLVRNLRASVARDLEGT